MQVGYFDNGEFELLDDADEAGAAAALAAFLALTPEDRLADARHVHAYYRDYRAEIGDAPWLDEEMGVIANAADIWRHVVPGGEIAIRRNGDGHWYVSVEANCTWDVEHGVMLVWRDGKTLTKAGGYDGHVVNFPDSASRGAREEVYVGMNEGFTTYVGQ